jgi:hypothetical protein
MLQIIAQLRNLYMIDRSKDTCLILDVIRSMSYEISGFDGDDIALILAANKGINGAGIEFEGHFVDLSLVLVLAPILPVAIHKDNIGVVVVDRHADLVSLLHLPPLSPSKGTTILLFPTLLWLNSPSWWFQLAIMPSYEL